MRSHGQRWAPGCRPTKKPTKAPGCRPTKKRSAVEAQSKMPQHHHPLLAWLLQVNESVKSEAGQSDDLDFPRALPGSRHDLKFEFSILQGLHLSGCRQLQGCCQFRDMSLCRDCSESMLFWKPSSSCMHQQGFWAISWRLTNFYDVNLAGHGLHTFMKSYEALT